MEGVLLVVLEEEAKAAEVRGGVLGAAPLAGEQQRTSLSAVVASPLVGEQQRTNVPSTPSTLLGSRLGLGLGLGLG